MVLPTPSEITTLPSASGATPVTPRKLASSAGPSTVAAAPLPASVEAFQKQAGCALRPGMGHAVGGEHGTQAPGGDANVPEGQVDAVKAQVVAPRGLYEPAAHCTQTEAPAAAANQPASQGRGYTDAAGQEAPAGQGAGVLRAPAAQKEPAGQAVRREDAQ